MIRSKPLSKQRGILRLGIGVTFGAETSQGSFSVTDIDFADGVSAQHDLSQYYASEIGAENVTNIELVAGSLPSGVSINVGNESLDYDGAGAAAVASGLQIRVTTDG